MNEISFKVYKIYKNSSKAFHLVTVAMAVARPKSLETEDKAQ